MICQAWSRLKSLTSRSSPSGFPRQQVICSDIQAPIQQPWVRRWTQSQADWGYAPLLPLVGCVNWMCDSPSFFSVLWSVRWRGLNEIMHLKRYPGLGCSIGTGAPEC